jgi:opacity protein-like surface antigen
MKKLIATVALLLMVAASVSAQNTDHQPQGLGYVFLGAGTHQMGLTAGFGGEGYVYKGLGMGVEVGTAGLGASANGEPNWIGVGSADLSYHFFPKKIRGHAAPFVAGGYTLFFGQDTDTGTGSIAHGFNVGGGVDIFVTKHAGARFDVRYNAHGDHILWPSFPNLAQFSFVAFRIGLTFR